MIDDILANIAALEGDLNDLRVHVKQVVDEAEAAILFVDVLDDAGVRCMDDLAGAFDAIEFFQLLGIDPSNYKLRQLNQADIDQISTFIQELM